MRLAGLALVAACATIPVPESTLDLDEVLQQPDSAEYTPFLAAGTGSITGQAFLRTRGGDVKRAAGSDVVLDPVTEYSKEWMLRRGDDEKYFPASPGAPLYKLVQRQTVADADGRFTFESLPPGSYFIRTTVSWYVPTLGQQGGVIRGVAVVKAGEESKIIITR